MREKSDSCWVNRGELNKEEVLKIAEENSLSTPFSAILQKRGLETSDIKGFLEETEGPLYAPDLLPDMEKATDMVYEGLKTGHLKIGVVNDYDVDGATSGVIMQEVLTRCGAEAFIITPDRNLDGYGISIRIIDEIINRGCRFIITTDNGISAKEQISYAKEKGCVVIVTDHHEVPYEEDDEGKKHYIYPDADAIVNQKRPDSEYPFRDICGAMIAYKFAESLLDRYSVHPEEREMLLNRWAELAGIGTVCDVMPLISENRTMVKRAIRLMRAGSSYIGIRQLIKVQGLDTEKISAYNIGFVIGPCINACGRMTGSVDMAIALLQEKDYIKAEKIANEIKALNDERKELSLKCEEEAELLCNKEQNIYLLYIPQSSPHIMGIVAGRIKESTGHPCICLTDHRDGIIKGSGRSIEGYDMFASMLKYRDLYESFGGHEQAVGVSFKKERLQEITELLNRDMESLDKSIYIKKEKIDLFIPMTSITPQFVKELDYLEPYGTKNEKPKLVTECAYITKLSRIGKEGQYIKMQIKEGEKEVSAVFFGNSGQFDDYIEKRYGKEKVRGLYIGADRIKMNFIYTPSFNTWQGKTTIQYIIADYQTGVKVV